MYISRTFAVYVPISTSATTISAPAIPENIVSLFYFIRLKHYNIRLPPADCSGIPNPSQPLPPTSKSLGLADMVIHRFDASLDQPSTYRPCEWHTHIVRRLLRKVSRATYLESFQTWYCNCALQKCQSKERPEIESPHDAF